MSSALLHTSGLSIGYPKNQVIAADLELQIQPGEFICLLGPNGTGKSTLIRTLSGLQKPLSGQCAYSGQNFEDITPRERARAVSVVLTEAQAAGMMSAEMLVSLGRHPYSGWLGKLSAKDREVITWALETAGASSLATRQIDELSDGERQKVNVARALAQEAKLMFLDEPTAFLDLPRRIELMALLRLLAHREQMGLLLSTHDLDLALRYADKLWIMTKDGIVQGYPEALAYESALAHAFAGHSLTWNHEQGTFEPEPQTCLSVALSGSGPAYIWTRRSLERLGYGIANQETAFSITIINTPDSNEWKVVTDGKETSFNLLSDLIGWMQSFRE